MINAILKIRVCQTRRILNDLGLGRVLFVVFMLAGLCYQLFITMNDKPQIGTPICLLLILFLHLKRKDLHFLKSHIDNYKWVILVEYFILSIPVIIGLAYYNRLTYLVGYLGVLASIIQVRRQFRKFTLNSFIQNWIPDDAFEWKSGVRKSLIFMVPVWLTGIIASFWPGTVPAVMLVLGLFIIGFIQKNEPLQLVLVFEKSAGRLLWFKIKQQLLLLSIFFLPLMLLYFFMHPQYWYIAAAFYIIIAICLIYAILCKYAFYRPDIETGNQVFMALGPASIFVSFLLPLILILSVRFYFKSINNLNQYLYDFH
ncbi:MAG TPA: hypothetical protein VK212_07005 [Lentimicrobium sp.]|nr:hypothetical protein [Lentimicrobium sp.]